MVSCELTQTNEYYHLSRTFRTTLKTGDTLVFIDAHSITDSLFVFRKISGTYRVSLSGSSCQTVPSAYFDLELLYLIKSDERGTNLYCGTDETTRFGDCDAYYDCNRTIVTDVKASGKGSSSPRLCWYGHYFKLDSQLSSMNVLSHTYNKVYCFKSSDPPTTDSIRELYYSLQDGIIQMNLMDGNVIKRIK
jgi:hypothetical protein